MFESYVYVLHRFAPSLGVYHSAILEAFSRTTSADLALIQLSRSRTLATVSDDPLDKKVEMTNWEKVNSMASLLHIHRTVIFSLS